MGKKVIHTRILRYSPDKHERTVDSFEIPFSSGLTVQVLLRYIYENLDPTLAFRDYRCGRGICNTCRVKVNGRVIRSCETLVELEKDLFLEPAGSQVIKDLVVQYD